MLKRSVHYFISAARLGSMRLASEEHHVAQSAISRRIQALEKEIGTPLLVRGSRGVVLTEAGARLVASIEAVDNETTELISEINELRQLRRGHVRIAAVESMLPNVLPRVLEAYLAAYPNISFDVTVSTTPTVVAMVRDGDADIGIAFSPTMTPDIKRLFRSRECLLAVMAPDHPLAVSKEVSVAEVAHWPFALQASGSGMRSLFEGACADAGCHLQPAVETSSLELLHHFAMAGSGISLLLRHTVRASVERKLLVVRRFKERVLEGSIDIIVLRERVVPAASQFFVQTFNTVFDALPEI